MVDPSRRLIYHINFGILILHFIVHKKLILKKNHRRNCLLEKNIINIHCLPTTLLPYTTNYYYLFEYHQKKFIPELNCYIITWPIKSKKRYVFFLTNIYFSFEKTTLRLISGFYISIFMIINIKAHIF